MRSLAPLFEPYTLKSLKTPNRFAMAPMTRQKSPGQIPGPGVVEYYRRRAAGGAGLILTEGTSPEHKAASNSAEVPAFFGGEALKGWEKVAKAVHAEGGTIMPQLWHQGIIRRQGQGPYPDVPSASPSGISKTGGKPVSEPLTGAQITGIVEGFAASAAHARELGFDGVEIHGAHGYLIDQFFWEGTNLREDGYGGSIEGRDRLACEIIAAIRAKVGNDFPILLRFSQWKQQDYDARLAHTPDELKRFLAPLAAAGADMFHCSTRRFWEPEFPDADPRLNLAGWTKNLTGLPTMTVGSVGLNDDFITAFRTQGTATSAAHLDGLIAMFERGEFDMVAVGRALIVNPDWVNKLRDGRFDEMKPYEPAALETLV